MLGSPRPDVGGRIERGALRKVGALDAFFFHCSSSLCDEALGALDGLVRAGKVARGVLVLDRHER